MENQNIFKNAPQTKKRELIQHKKNIVYNNRKQNNNNIINKQINFNQNPSVDNIKMKKNIIYYKKNNNINDNMNINNEISEPLESTLNSNVYEKNIVSLKEKIKDQENNIEYLNDRLKNYDNTKLK